LRDSGLKANFDRPIPETGATICHFAMPNRKSSRYQGPYAACR
jgi:hypothetical protein